MGGSTGTYQPVPSLSRGAFLISEPAKLKPYFPCSLAAKHAPGCIPHALAWTWRTGVWHRSLGVLLDKPTGSEATAAPPFPSSSAEILSDGGQGAFAILVCCLVTQSCWQAAWGCHICMQLGLPGEKVPPPPHHLNLILSFCRSPKLREESLQPNGENGEYQEAVQ